MIPLNVLKIQQSEIAVNDQYDNISTMYPVPELNDKQLDRLSEFLSNFSILTLATLVLPNIFGVDRPNIDELKLGLEIAITSLFASLFIIRK